MPFVITAWECFAVWQFLVIAVGFTSECHLSLQHGSVSLFGNFLLLLLLQISGDGEGGGRVGDGIHINVAPKVFWSLIYQQYR